MASYNATSKAGEGCSEKSKIKTNIFCPDLCAVYSPLQCSGREESRAGGAEPEGPVRNGAARYLESKYKLQ